MKYASGDGNVYVKVEVYAELSIDAYKQMFKTKKEFAEHVASCINGQDFDVCPVYYRGQEI